MSAVAIYVCHDCNVSKYDGSHLTPENAIVSIAWNDFTREHLYHKISLQSDAHGQIMPDDFIKNQMTPTPEQIEKMAEEFSSALEKKYNAIQLANMPTIISQEAFVAGAHAMQSLMDAQAVKCEKADAFVKEVIKIYYHWGTDRPFPNSTVAMKQIEKEIEKFAGGCRD